MEKFSDDVLRSEDLAKRYKIRKKEEGARQLDLRSLKMVWTFKYWLVVENEFPYDKIAERHHILVPRFEVQEYIWKLNAESQKELTEIRKWAEGMGYDVLMENLPRNRTIKGQFHMHLLRYRNITE